MANDELIAVIGGSGLYSFEGLEDRSERAISTPFGDPSSPIVTGEFHGHRVAFLARHGVGHVLPPHTVNYRANIYALKKLGATRVVSVSACGSLREDYAPGHIVIPDQLFDRTKNRARTFFDSGVVAHVNIADPFCSQVSEVIADGVVAAEGTVHRGGAFVTIEGPAFSTRVESNTYRAWGLSIVGMTTSPEAFLAREAELCYAVMAHVTDYDVWRTAEDPVTVEMVFKILRANAELAEKALVNIITSMPAQHSCRCHQALKDALTTSPDHISRDSRERLALLVDPYLP